MTKKLEFIKDDVSIDLAVHMFFSASKTEDFAYQSLKNFAGK